MIKEIWKDIPEYEGRYQVSNIGRVKSLRNNIELVMSLNSDKDGYLQVSLRRDGKYYNQRISQLVAICFLGHKKSGMSIVVDHINGNRKDNRVENLQLVSSRLNATKDLHKWNFSSKHTGVSVYEKTKFRAIIIFNKKLYSLGVYNTEIDAKEAYDNALNKIKNGIFTDDKKRKGYYVRKTDGMFVICKKGLPFKSFKTEEESIKFIQENITKCAT